MSVVSRIRMTTQRNLKELLEALYQDAKSDWPECTITQAQFCERATAILAASGTSDDLLVRAEKLHAVDLMLVTASLLGCPFATKHIVQDVLPSLALGRVTDSANDAQEVRQIVADKLLVAPEGEQRKLSEYSGRGPLASWLQVIAVRCAIDLHRKRGRVRDLDTKAMDRIGATDEIELEYLKGRYRPEFRRALEDAFATLSKRERSVLRLNLIDQLNIAEIGLLYSVHRATVARWIADARQRLFSATRDGLDQALGSTLTPSEFGAMVELVVSQMDLSIQRLLQTHPQTGSSTK